MPIPTIRCWTRRARPTCLVVHAYTLDQMTGISALVATPQMKRRCSSFRGERLPGVGAGEVTIVAAALTAAISEAAARIAASKIVAIPIPPGFTAPPRTTAPPPSPPLPPPPMLHPYPRVSVPEPGPAHAPILMPTVPGRGDPPRPVSTAPPFDMLWVELGRNAHGTRPLSEP